MSDTTDTIRLPRDTQRLLELSRSLAQSGSHLEDTYWQTLLGKHIQKLLHTKKGNSLDTALNALGGPEADAYEALLEQAETQSESLQIEHEGQLFDALMFTAPVVAWTRYQLPHSYNLSNPQLATLTEQLHTHILADNTQFTVLPQLIGFDQLPTNFQDTYELTQRLARATLRNRTESAPGTHTHYEGLLADARFLVGVVVVPAGEPLFRWQSPQGKPTRKACFEAWQKTAEPLFSQMFTGCSVQCLHPDAYYVNNRETDRRMRPLALQAAVTWLQNVAGLQGNNLRATIVSCGQNVPEEYRIGFSTQQDNQVIYGCLWPILSKEEASIDDTEHDEPYVTTDIVSLLNQLGITDVRRLPGLYPIDTCEDCGAPYFPDPLGELQHPELPEEIDITPIHLH